MMLKEMVFAQALLLAGELEPRQTELLRVLCDGAVSALSAQLREGITPEDCKADFIAAAGLYALAALGSAEESGGVEEFKAGDLTVKKSASSRDAASRCLEIQAQRILAPFLKDRFSFMGV